MNAKPVEAIEEFRKWGPFQGNTLKAILAYLDSLPDSVPDGAVPVVWPAELTLERLEKIASSFTDPMDSWTASAYDALRALAAIAPQKKKRVVNLWRDGAGNLRETEHEWAKGPQCTWTLVARNVELED